MADRNRHRRSRGKNTNDNLHNTDQQKSASSMISTRRHFRVNSRSNDKASSAQSSGNSSTVNVKPQPNPSPNNLVTSELSCKLSDTTTNPYQGSKANNYSARNMLRNPERGASIAPAGPSVCRQSTQQLERSPWENPDDVGAYIRLTEDCFIYFVSDGLLCLLCGKIITGRWTVDQHIDSSEHAKQYERLDLRLLEENLDESSLQMCTIKALCDKWYSTYSLTDDLIQMRNSAITELEYILGSINPECQFRIQGSSFFGTATTNSDVDLELIHPNSKLFASDPRSKKSIHHRLVDPDAEYGNQFNEHSMHYDLASNPVETLFKIARIVDRSQSLPFYPFIRTSDLGRLNSKVPSITLKHHASRSTLTVNCYSERRFQMARLLRIYMGLDPRVEQLGLLVKVWAKFCHIDNPDRGSLPSHAYVIMMIYFLQRTEPPVLPCLHELVAQNVKSDRSEGISNINEPHQEDINKFNGARDEDLEEEEEDDCLISIEEYIGKDFKWTSENKAPTHVLFIQFFKSMIEVFSRISDVITIRTLKPVTSHYNFQSKAIEHPTSKGVNISRCIASLKTYEFIRDSFSHTYYYLTTIPIDENLKPRKIIKSDPRDYINLYVNYNRLSAYRDMKEGSINMNYDPITQMMQQKLFARDVEIIHALTEGNQISPTLPKNLANLYDPGFFRPQNITYSFSCHLCRSTCHSKENCPRNKIDNLRDEYSSYDHALDERANLDSALMTLYKRETISKDLAAEHSRILSALKRIINESLEMRLNFVPYGSTVNNLGSCDSDLDICVTVKDNPTGKDVDCVTILKSILGVLGSIAEVHEIQPVFSAKVPIIRFKYNQFDIDLSMYNQCAIYNSKLLRAYSMINPKVAPLCSLVKKFAKACGIADASRGSLSSYAWSLLVIYFLQKIDPPVLPVLQEAIDGPVRGSFGVNGWNVWFHDKPVRLPEHPYSLTQLLKLFFLYYGCFDFENQVVAIRKSERITKFQKSWNASMIAIEDPFELTFNLANRLGDPMSAFIISSFAQTYRHIVKIQYLIDGGFNYSSKRLAEVLFDGISITKVRPPLRGCLICHKIGHKVKDCPEKDNAPTRSSRKNRPKGFKGGKWRA